MVLEIVIHLDKDITKVHSAVPCQSRLNSKHRISYKLCLQWILWEAANKTSPLQDYLVE